MNTLGGPAAYLSEMKPLRYESTPYLGVAWPLMTDRSVRGNDLRLGGGSYDKGLGLHSAAAATYAIPAGTIRFECTAGLDEETGRRGSVVLRIKAKGRTLVKDLELAGGDASARIATSPDFRGQGIDHRNRIRPRRRRAGRRRPRLMPALSFRRLAVNESSLRTDRIRLTSQSSRLYWN